VYKGVNGGLGRIPSSQSPTGDAAAIFTAFFSKIKHFRHILV